MRACLLGGLWLLVVMAACRRLTSGAEGGTKASVASSFASMPASEVTAGGGGLRRRRSLSVCAGLLWGVENCRSGTALAFESGSPVSAFTVPCLPLTLPLSLLCALPLSEGEWSGTPFPPFLAFVKRFWALVLSSTSAVFPLRCDHEYATCPSVDLTATINFYNILKDRWPPHHFV